MTFNYLSIDENELSNLLKGKKIIVSISGMDNVGKTTQAKMLNEKYGNLFSKPLHINQTKAFPKLNDMELSKWWFNKDNAENFVDTIYHACAERYIMALKNESPIVILDKGIDFYDTRVKATLLTEGFSPDKIATMIKNAKAKYKIFNSIEDLKIIITAKNRDHVKDRRKDDDEYYEKYITYNIETLNKALDEDKNGEFRKVEFIDGGAEDMHKDIAGAIAKNILTKTQYKRHQDILEHARECFGNNLQLLVLAGSAGKGRFVEGWSDIDVYFVLKEYDHNQATSFQKWIAENKDVHIGTTFLAEKDLKKDRINNRTKVMFYELSMGKNTILYQNPEFHIPQYNVKDIVSRDSSEFADAINTLRRCLVAGDDSNRTNIESKGNLVTKLIKNIVLVQKIALRNSYYSKVSGGYIDTSSYFISLFEKVCMKNGSNQNYKQIYDTLASLDLLDCVKKHNEPDMLNKLMEYGEAVLKAVDLIDNASNDEKKFDNETLELI